MLSSQVDFWRRLNTIKKDDKSKGRHVSLYVYVKLNAFGDKIKCREHHRVLGRVLTVPNSAC